MIEIERPSGCRVRVGSTVRPAALRLVLDALESKRCSEALASSA